MVSHNSQTQFTHIAVSNRKQKSSRSNTSHIYISDNNSMTTEIASQIANKLIFASEGVGTDEKAFYQAVERAHEHGVSSEVNDLLIEKGLSGIKHLMVQEFTPGFGNGFAKAQAFLDKGTLEGSDIGSIDSMIEGGLNIFDISSDEALSNSVAIVVGLGVIIGAITAFIVGIEGAPVWATLGLVAARVAAVLGVATLYVGTTSFAKNIYELYQAESQTDVIAQQEDLGGSIVQIATSLMSLAPTALSMTKTSALAKAVSATSPTKSTMPSRLAMTPGSRPVQVPRSQAAPQGSGMRVVHRSTPRAPLARPPARPAQSQYKRANPTGKPMSPRLSTSPAVSLASTGQKMVRTIYQGRHYHVSLQAISKASSKGARYVRFIPMSGKGLPVSIDIQKAISIARSAGFSVY
jgi:hypothetical protein